MTVNMFPWYEFVKEKQESKNSSRMKIRVKETLRVEVTSIRWIKNKANRILNAPSPLRVTAGPLSSRS